MTGRKAQYPVFINALHNSQDCQAATSLLGLCPALGTLSGPLRLTYTPYPCWITTGIVIRLTECRTLLRLDRGSAPCAKVATQAQGVRPSLPNLLARLERMLGFHDKNSKRFTKYSRSHGRLSEDKLTLQPLASITRTAPVKCAIFMSNLKLTNKGVSSTTNRI